MKTFLIVLLLIVGLILSPWISILAVNQLFSISIPFTFWNWLSILWLHFAIYYKN